MIVVDTNIIASLWVPNDMDQLAYKILEKDPDWVAPSLWRSEFRNVLTKYLRANILDLPTAIQVSEEAEKLMDSKEFDINSLQVLKFASSSSCSSYDCEFVALADDLDLQLVTFDKKITREFPIRAIHPKQFSQSG